MKRISSLWFSIGALLLPLACTTPRPPEPVPQPPKPVTPAPPAIPQGANQAQVTVFFATDRQRSTNPDSPANYFSGDRSKESRLTYGKCRVHLPRLPSGDPLLRPSSTWIKEPKPTKDVVLADLEVLGRGAFVRMVGEVVQKPDKGKKAFLFVHGYNVSFEDAALRTAQIAYDIQFPGAPVFFSWPSKASVLSYLADEATVEWSQSNLKAFLLDFLHNTNADSVYVMAHSMGSRAATKALRSVLQEKPELRAKVQALILAAPDIDRGVFLNDLLPFFRAQKLPVTLYASSNDLALKASKVAHNYPRAGDAGQALILADGVETLDASTVPTDFLGHSYFAEVPALLADLFALIHCGPSNPLRGLWLKPNQAFGRPYSVFDRPTIPHDKLNFCGK